MKRIPVFDATAPVACTLDEADIPDRLELMERLRAQVVAVEPDEHGLLLRFPRHHQVEVDVRRFARDEKRCCQFWGFEVGAGDDDVVLRWEGPPGTEGLLERIAACFRGEEPVSSLADLL